MGPQVLRWLAWDEGVVLAYGLDGPLFVGFEVVKINRGFPLSDEKPLGRERMPFLPGIRTTFVSRSFALGRNSVVAREQVCAEILQLTSEASASTFQGRGASKGESLSVHCLRRLPITIEVRRLSSLEKGAGVVDER